MTAMTLEKKADGETAEKPVRILFTSNVIGSAFNGTKAREINIGELKQDETYKVVVVTKGNNRRYYGETTVPKIREMAALEPYRGATIYVEPLKNGRNANGGNR